MATVATPKTEPERHMNPDALYEVVNGQVVEKASMSYYATIIARRIYDALRSYLQNHQLGQAIFEAMFILNRVADLQRRPDVAYLSFDRWPADREIPEEGECEAVPDLVVEVISTHDRDRDVQQKLEEYFAYGVRRVWHVRPSTKRIHDYTSPTQVAILGLDDTLDGGTLLPGLQIPVGPLFRRTVV
jgi:Uma2 family endonuclease